MQTTHLFLRYIIAVGYISEWTDAESQYRQFIMHHRNGFHLYPSALKSIGIIYLNKIEMGHTRIWILGEAIRKSFL